MALRWCWLSCLRWPNRQYVVIRACLNLNVPLLGIRCTMTQSQLHTRLLHYIGIDDIRLCTDVDYIYGFGRAGSTCIFEFECLVTWYAAYDALWYHHNCTLAYYSTTIAIPHDSARWCWCWLNVCNGIVLVLDEQEVCCMMLNLNVSLLGMMHHCTIAITHSSAIQLQWQWHTYDTAIMLFECMERYRVGF